MKQFKISALIVLISALIIPSLIYAAWWNPSSWSVWNAFKPKTATTTDTPKTVPQIAQSTQQYAQTLWNGLPSGNTTAVQCESFSKKVRLLNRPENGDFTMLMDYFYSSTKQRCFGQIKSKSKDNYAQEDKIIDLIDNSIIVACKQTTNRAPGVPPGRFNGAKIPGALKNTEIICSDAKNSWDSKKTGFPPPYPINNLITSPTNNTAAISSSTWQIIKKIGR